jgi:hypothetical protein
VNAALTAVVEALEAERLIPIPRADRAVAVDSDDLTLLLSCLTTRSMPGSFPPGMAAALARLEAAVRPHAVRRQFTGRPPASRKDP